MYTIYDYLWLFVFYSVAGWAVGTAAAAAREKKFLDVGFLYGPFCPAYGFGGLLFSLFLPELRNDLVFLFIGGSVLSFLVTMATGFVLERIFHRKWWDYSRKRFHFGSYVNLPYMVVWGIGAVLSISFLNPFVTSMVHLLPRRLSILLLLAIYAVTAIDMVSSCLAVLSIHSRLRKIELVEDVSESLQKAADQLGGDLAGWVTRRIQKAYPSLSAKELLKARQEEELRREQAKEQAGVFAVGLSFYKLFLLFFLGSLLGDLTETIFCWYTTGRLMSRSSLVYGPFSIVWGFGCVLLTIVLYQYKNRSDSYIFLFGTVLGGAYEYICSVLSELVFGTVFWDYSHLPYNLGGRINLLYCFFWGIAAVVWMKLIYPRLSDLIEKIPKKIGIVVTWILVVFMVFNMLLSSLALIRYNQRNTGTDTSQSTLAVFLDEHFPDERMKRIYPNAITK